ncbi:MAG: hypothetical protein QF398_08785 [Alphaproteobacteria bacterium]|nr:hypothetical protein [Alphaproteobacteria bacterium]
MIDEKGRPQKYRPTEEIECHQGRPPKGVFDVPDDTGDGPPLPKKKREHGRRRQHEGAALSRLGDHPGPLCLERRSRHQGVLQNEDRQHHHVNSNGHQQGLAGAAVDALGHQQIFFEARGVEHGSECQQVADYAVYQDQEFCHVPLQGMFASQLCRSAAFERAWAALCKKRWKSVETALTTQKC